MNDLLTDENADMKFHLLDWCDTYVIKTEVFKTKLWKLWINTINESGGIYKFRWGDNEIISLFANMTQESIVNLGYVASGHHDQGKFRYIQDIAPGVEYANR